MIEPTRQTTVTTTSMNMVGEAGLFCRNASMRSGRNREYRKTIDAHLPHPHKQMSAEESEPMRPYKTPEEDTEEFLGLLEGLRERLVIVEGKRDRRALKALGVNNVTEISGKPLPRVVTEVLESGQKRVVILTDFDHTGTKLARRLTVLLQAVKIHPEKAMRLKVMAFGKTRIEDFNTVGQRLNGLVCVGIGDAALIPHSRTIMKRGDSDGEIGANINEIYYQGTYQGKRSRRKTRRHRGDLRAD